MLNVCLRPSYKRVSLGAVCRWRGRYHFNSSAKVAPPRLLELVLLRPGESEGAVAYHKSEKGDQSLYSGEFLARQSWMWRLTDRGRSQVDAAAAWLRGEAGGPGGGGGAPSFQRLLVSEHVRAMETAARLALPGARWRQEVFLRERDWGELDALPWKKRMKVLGEEAARRADRDAFLWAPPGGESMAAVALRADRVLGLLHREAPGQRALVIAHQEVLWALRQRIEGMGPQRFNDLRHSPRAKDQVHHAQIVIYSRKNPTTGEVADSFRWLRSVCPWNPALSADAWQEVNAEAYLDNRMLLAACEQYPRMFTGSTLEADPESRPGGLWRPPSPSSSSSSSLPPPPPLPDHPFGHRPGPAPARPVEYRADDELPAAARAARRTRGTPLPLRTAVVVTKTTRLEVERQKNPGLGTAALREELARQGVDYGRLESSHEAHASSLAGVLAALERWGARARVVRGHLLRPADLAGADAALACGGDGTFLQTCTHIGGSRLPVVGVNTDVVGSQGALTCCAAGGDFHEGVLARLAAGDFAWKRLRRIQIHLIKPDGTEKTLPYLGLNEVFLSEMDPCRPSIFNIGVDGEERQTVRSSGLIASSGTGSTAWFTSAARVHQSTVMRVLDAAGINTNFMHANSLKDQINSQIAFNPESDKLGFVVREPIINRAHNVKSRFGHCRRLSVRSLGWNAALVVDGLCAVPFAFGSQAVLTIADEAHSIHTVEFDGTNDDNNQCSS